jgi:hypothetical protein
MSKLLFDEELSLKVNRTLAAEIGLNEAVLYAYLLKNSTNCNLLLDIQDMSKSLGFVSEKTISRAIKKLELLDFIKTKHLTAHEKYDIISAKKMNGLGIGNKICSWCGCKTIVLHEHHYPIQLKDNGTETVLICPNCHSEFHKLNILITIEKVM